MYILQRVGYSLRSTYSREGVCFNHVGKKQNKEEEN